VYLWHTIVDIATSRIVGHRALWSAGEPSICTTGSWLGSTDRGQGLGTEELAAVVEFAHHHLGCKVVLAATDHDNRASLRQHAKAGFSGAGYGDVVFEHGRPAEALVLSHVDRDARTRCPHLAEPSA
jgi:RimJ/RimL family protein N-acetyltransferase